LHLLQIDEGNDWRGWLLGHIWRSEWLGGDTPFEPEERSQRWENAARYVL